MFTLITIKKTYLYIFLRYSCIIILFKNIKNECNIIPYTALFAFSLSAKICK